MFNKVKIGTVKISSGLSQRGQDEKDNRWEIFIK